MRCTVREKRIGIADVRFLARLGMLETHDEAAFRQVRIGVLIDGSHHRHRGNALQLQDFCGFGVGPGAGPRPEPLVELSASGEP